ncbi:hypothetical protein pp309_000042 [Proteus phage 309]|uniref:Uncharacterized protein n=1 Tax=Proteus phage 309 TaxID=2894355 RepID=A0AAE8YHP0_9CAUD|nr:hypothetical protein pp309_000042 [Proteus phage 309]
MCSNYTEVFKLLNDMEACVIRIQQLTQSLRD